MASLPLRTLLVIMPLARLNPLPRTVLAKEGLLPGHEELEPLIGEVQDGEAQSVAMRCLGPLGVRRLGLLVGGCLGPLVGEVLLQLP